MNPTTTHHRRRVTGTLTAIAALSLVAAACGDDDAADQAAPTAAPAAESAEMSESMSEL